MLLAQPSGVFLTFHETCCHIFSYCSRCVQAKRGGLKDTDAIDLLTTVFKAVLDQSGVDASVRLPAGSSSSLVGRAAARSSDEHNVEVVSVFLPWVHIAGHR